MITIIPTGFPLTYRSFVWLIILLMAAFDLLALICFGVDKRKATRKKWRIPEATLLWLSLFGGLGGFLGMKLFHHKTKHTAFIIIVPLCLVLRIALLGILLYFTFI